MAEQGMETVGGDLKPHPNPSNSIQTNEKWVDNCVICLEQISERAVAVPCDHLSFDFICLASWAAENPKCPLCNTTLTAIEYDWGGPKDYKTYYIPKKDGDAKTSNRGSSAYSLATTSSQPYRQRSTNRHSRQAPEQIAWHNTRLEQETALAFRRQVYRNGMYAMHVGSNPMNDFQEFDARSFAASEELQQRAKKWIRRELQIFDPLTPPETQVRQPELGNREFLLNYIVSMLKHVDIKGASGKAEDLLARFLGRFHARIFLHELNAYLRSPYSDLAVWDEYVQHQKVLDIR